MSKRKTNGQFAKRHSPAVVGLSWVAGFVSVSLVCLSGRMLLANLAAFRSCDTNSDGLRIASCGKHAVNFGDLLLLILFCLSLALTFSLFTHSLRMSRRVAP